MKKTFDVDLCYIFHAWCKVKAKSLEEAQNIAFQNMTAISPKVENNNCDKIVDWTCEHLADTEVLY